MSYFVKIKNHIVLVCDFFVDLLFPIACLECGKEGEFVCLECFNKLKPRHRQSCFGCKKENNSGRFCVNCKSRYYLDGILIAGNYDDELLAKILKYYKYYFVKNISFDLGKFLILFFKDWQNSNDFNVSEYSVMSIPLHRRRLGWRGYNQSELLAIIFAGYFSLELLTNSLIRVKYKTAQAKLGELERRENIKDCFKFQGENLKGLKVILIDDITTTSATLNEAAKVLKENGAKEVLGLVVAKG